MARKVDELPVYCAAQSFSAAVSAYLRRPALCKDRDLRDQIARALDSLEANIEEGFEQGTDRAFARYLTHSKGSVGELQGHLRRARRKAYLTEAELEPLLHQAESLGRMLGGFIKYLHGCDWKDRGRHGHG
jgi:four helix bundle protein